MVSDHPRLPRLHQAMRFREPSSGNSLQQNVIYNWHFKTEKIKVIWRARECVCVSTFHSKPALDS